MGPANLSPVLQRVLPRRKLMPEHLDKRRIMTENRSRSMNANKDTISIPDGQEAHMELVAGYFDNHSQYWSDAYLKPQGINDFVLIERKNIAVDFLCSRLQPPASVLDAGCGAGLATLALAQKGFHVHAVDISEKILDVCQQNLIKGGIPAGSYTISRADILEAGFSTGSFDGIVALGFLQYQPDELDALAVLKSLLKPGGLLVLSGPVRIKVSNYFGLANVYDSVKGLFKKSKLTRDVAVLHQISAHYYGAGRFNRLLNAAGFQLLDCTGHGFVNFAIISDWTSRGQHFLHRFFTRLSNFLPIGRFGNDMVVVARKN